MNETIEQWKKRTGKKPRILPAQKIPKFHLEPLVPDNPCGERKNPNGTKMDRVITYPRWVEPIIFGD